MTYTFNINKKKVKQLMAENNIDPKPDEAKFDCALCGKKTCTVGQNACEDCIAKHAKAQRQFILNVVATVLMMLTFMQVPLQNVADEWMNSETAQTSLAIRILVSSFVAALIVGVVNILRGLQEAQKTVLSTKIEDQVIVINDLRSQLLIKEMELVAFKEVKKVP